MKSMKGEMNERFESMNERFESKFESMEKEINRLKFKVGEIQKRPEFVCEKRRKKPNLAIGGILGARRDPTGTFGRW